MLAALGHWQWQPALGPAFAMLVVFAVPLLLLDVLEARREEEYLGEHASMRTRMALAAAMTLATLLLAAPENSAFIYFQF
jgi:hypothetical protein